MNLNFANFPVLTTERLVLRQLADQDAAQIHRLRSDPAVNAYVGRVLSTGVEEAAAFIRKINDSILRNESMYWAISLQEDPGLIGTICYWNFDTEHETIELGYEMLPAFQGKGLMKEAVIRVIGYGFEEMKAKTITAFPSADNDRSVALLINTGFKTDGKSYTNIHGDVENMATYTLIRPANWSR
ncbi:MAG: GNAT family N-acetyltransferase [Pseudomonadota bacterium]